MDITGDIKQLTHYVNLVDILILVPGILIFSWWLAKTSFGRYALVGSEPRRNNMPIYFPFIPLLVQIVIFVPVVSIARDFLPYLSDWQSVFIENLFLTISAMAAIITTIFLAKTSFAMRLKGFGLNVRTVHKDLLVAVMNLLAVYPLLFVAIVLTIYFGQLIWGQDFKMHQHEELEMIAAHTQLAVRIIIVATAVFIGPVFEEMLFRGMFQTMIRSVLEESPFFEGFRSSVFKVWVSILISSGLFAAAHYDRWHWPALFVLGACLGYSYEKSGSLFRPIFIHSFFNGLSIIAALNQ